MRRQAFCVHGHFYQPPRENPFTGKIPFEPGAAPFVNWNEKIYHQCYKPNAEQGNFGRISFDLGPTLAVWMEENHPDTLQKIVDQENGFYRNHGVSNAMAQSYNHTILPLASDEDKITQIKWGIADFVARFGHEPLGLWAPETAINMQTLETMADCGIKYTILAPWQSAVRKDLDKSRPYWVELSGNKKIAVFFYDDFTSMRVSFIPQATENADRFIKNELTPLYPTDSRRERYFVVASDGELYGHHQPLRDYFLTWLTTGALKNSTIENIMPAVWLNSYPPDRTIRILNNSSWSCHHGIKRWSTVCGCCEHGEWKAPLLRAFEKIAVIVDSEMQQILSPYGIDLLPFRNEYATVLTKQETPDQLVDRVIGTNLTPEQRQKITLMMAAQYERQRMFTSCGWFFGDFDRIEPMNNIQYSAKAIDLTERATGKEFQKMVSKMLSRAESWQSGLKASVVFNNAFLRHEETNPKESDAVESELSQQ